MHFHTFARNTQLCCQTLVTKVCLQVQGLLVHNMRYLASVVSNCFTAFGELLALHKRFAELSGGVRRYPHPPPPPLLLALVLLHTSHSGITLHL